MKLLVSVFVALSLAAWSAAQTPIPSRPQGYYMVKAAAEEKVVIDVFYDHLCDGSKANWPILSEVVNTHLKMKDNVVTIYMHIFPLPYHHNAFFMQQAGEVVRNLADHSGSFVDYIQYVFDYQDEFLDGSVNLTETQVKHKIANFTQMAMHKTILAESVMEGFTDKDIVQRSRYAWKYGCSRGISGTPQFLVNGVHMPDGASYTATQWESFITSLINGSA